MSHFYGTMQGNRGEVTRCGTKRSGMETIAASWSGAIRTYLFWDEGIQRSCYEVWEVTWHGVGINRLIERGTINDYPEENRNGT